MFNVSVSNIDESQQADEPPGKYVLRLAREKALATATHAHSDDIVIAADTTVVDGDSILGKPRDMAEAEKMLKQLRGHTHQVYTGLAIYRIRDEKLLSELCITDVPMRTYSDDEISAYVQSGDALDKAGAYAIQHPEFHPVESMQGCYASVMGLPLCHLVRALRKVNVHPGTDISASCQGFLNYDCPVTHAILRGENVG
jgi:nucleoside triphosphate pyrophosphatase